MEASIKNWSSLIKSTFLTTLNWKSLTCLLLFLFFGNTKAQLCFNTATSYFSTSISFGITTADFNNDGNLDVATTQSWANGSVLLGTGTGSFLPATTFTTVGGYNVPLFSSIVSADFNNDSDVDVAVITSTLLEVFLGNGTGTFSIPSSTISISANALITKDFNLDGNTDLAVADNGLNQVSIFLGNGTGNFSSPTSFSVGSSSDLYCADFNGDGNPDLATTNSSSVSVLLGTGTGLFGTPSNFLVTNNLLALTSSDLNNDGNPDLACVNYGTVSVLIGNGSGNFGTATNYTISSSATILDILTADLNGDLKVDIAIPDYGTHSIYILLGDGLGNFSTPFTFGITSGNPWAILSGDFNGDSKTDIVTGADNSAGGISVFLNCTALGISHQLISKEIKIFPNPASNEVFISPTTLEKQELCIFDTNGKRVLLKNFIGNSSIDVSHLTDGVYYLAITSNQKTTNSKIVITK
jgi:hypothetical protein